MEFSESGLAVFGFDVFDTRNAPTIILGSLKSEDMLMITTPKAEPISVESGPARESGDDGDRRHGMENAGDAARRVLLKSWRAIKERRQAERKAHPVEGGRQNHRARSLR